MVAENRYLLVTVASVIFWLALRELFDKFDVSRNHLSIFFQIMFMVRGLCEDYDKMLRDFRDGQKNSTPKI